MKFDKEHIDILVNCLSSGTGRLKACEAAGIVHETFQNWMNEDSDFSDAIKKAELDGADAIQEKAEKAIQDKFSEQWQSAAWWLERTNPTKYKERKELGTPDNQPIQITIVK